MKRKTRPIPKGRAVEAKALADVQRLLGDAPRRRDLLIEHLHRLNDHFGHLPATHLAALAQEMRLALTEVYEVATFYHHFEVVKEGESAPPQLTVRVCDSIACELAGAQALLKLDLGPGVRVIAAPCVGRCEVAPCVVVGQNPLGNASADTVRAAVRKKALACPVEPYIGYAQYRKDGGYKLIADCLAGKHTRDAITKVMEDSGLRGLGGAGFPAGRKWRIVAAEPEPRVMAVNLDEGEPGTFKDRWYLERDPHRFLEGMLIAAWCLRWHPAGGQGRHPARFRHAAAARLLHRLGGRRRAVQQGQGGSRGAQPDEILPRRVLRQVHALPCGHGEGGNADAGKEV